MKIEFDEQRLRGPLARGRALLAAVVATTWRFARRAATTVASGLVAAAVTSSSWLATAWRRSHERTHRSVSAVRRGLTSDRSRRLGRTAWRGFVGRRVDVSALALVAVPVLTLLAQWWALGVGYRRLEGWVQGTWYGTAPQSAVFFGVALLVVLAAGSAAVNSGLVPTTLLTMAPIFGAAFTRYGLTFEGYGTVGLVDATGTALAFAALFGVPLGFVGFVVGTALRRVVRTLLDERRPEAFSDGV